MLLLRGVVLGVVRRTTGGWYRYSSKLLTTTLTELNAIAAAATVGGSRSLLNGKNKPAAAGIAKQL